MTAFTVIYTAAVFLVSYLLTFLLRRHLNINTAKEIRRKPSLFVLSGGVILLACSLCGALAALIHSTPENYGAALRWSIILCIIESFASIFMLIKFKRIHSLFTVPPAILSYIAVLVACLGQGASFAAYLAFALHTAFIYSAANFLFNEARERAGLPLPATAKLNRSPSMRAQVMCGGTQALSKHKYVYHGVEDCYAQTSLCGGSKYCEYGCLGCGSCVKACKFSAIVMIDGIAAIKSSRCVGCGSCVKACPRCLIKMIPRDTKFWVGCSSAKQSAEQCRVSCTGCGKCASACPAKAISLKGGCAVIDQSKCSGCGNCVKVCPRHCIWSFPGTQN